MPAPTNERQALERERDELSAQLADYRREIAATGGEHQEQRERLAWQIRRSQKRLGEVEARLTSAGGELCGHRGGPFGEFLAELCLPLHRERRPALLLTRPGRRGSTNSAYPFLSILFR